jgi:YgiT-type zinc finger domain-containing protein
MMNRKVAQYGRCESCGGAVVERRLTVDRRFRGRLYEFENVPVGVCRECGQRVYRGPVLEQLERLSRDRGRIKRTIRVTVAAFESAAA